MKNYFGSSLLAFFLMATFIQSPNAAPLGQVQISLHGNVVASSCTFKQGDDDQTIPLGDWPVKNFTSNGTKTVPVYFGISLTDCSAATTELTFSGKQDSSSAGLLALDSDSTAKNVAIEILDAERNRVALNQTVPNTVDGNGNVAYTFYANYISTGVVTAGTANGTMLFTINYA